MSRTNAIECKVVLISNYEERNRAIEFNQKASDAFLLREVPEPEYDFKKMGIPIRNLRDDLSCFYMDDNNFIVIEKRNGYKNVILYSEEIWETLFNLCI